MTNAAPVLVLIVSEVLGKLLEEYIYWKNYTFSNHLKNMAHINLPPESNIKKIDYSEHFFFIIHI